MDITSLLNEITSSLKLSFKETLELTKVFIEIRNKKINILITGGTGTGKSSTINALFKNKVAKVGVSLKAQTKETEQYKIDNLIIWDSPGLGESEVADKKNAEKIIEILQKKENGKYLIDLVLVLIDGTNRQLQPTYDLINKIIIPNIGKERIVVGINKIDKIDVIDGSWDTSNNKPTKELIAYLEETIIPEVKSQINNETGVQIEPIYYVAGRTIQKNNGIQEQKPGYNLTKLLYHILTSLPQKERIAIMNTTNDDKETWESNDQKKNYKDEVKKTIFDTILGIITPILPNVVEKVGGVVKNIASKFFSFFK